MAMEDDSIKAHCNSCGPHRTHRILFKVEREWPVEDEIDGTDRYYLLECAGCERITLRHDSLNSYERDEDGHSIVTTVYYPPAISRKESEWLDAPLGPFWLDRDSTIRKLLEEIYTALHNDSRALAVMGIRALIEHIMIEQVGDNGGIGSNVDRFIKEGFIAPKSEALFREHLIESGHAAMHRAYFPKPSDISALLDITESLIETIYVHPHRAKGQKIPPRKPKGNP